MRNEELLAIIEKAASEEWEELDLSGRSLRSLPPEIGKLTKLKRLMLGKWDKNTHKWRGNLLASLPSEIGQLASLESLNLAKNLLTNLPKEISQLSSLQNLNLSENQLISLPSEIGKLRGLKYFSLYKNQLRSLPLEVTKLKKIRYLNLRGNQLKHLPKELADLSFLQELDLKGNHLKNFPAEIAQAENLQQLYLSNNPLETPPIEIANQGLLAIRDYFRQQQEQDSERLYEAKLIIVGEGGAGKTTFAKKILDPNYKVPTPEDSTQGIDVLRWDFTQENGENFRVNIWDFGGQEIYHATHQFFLSKRSLYILVADSRKEHPHLDYWFDIVELLSGKSPLILIKNEVDNRPVAIDEPQFKARFDNLKDSVTTNFAEAKDIDNIYKSIKYHITSLPHVGSSLPKTWTRVRETLENDERNYITKHEYLTICKETGFKQDKDSLQLSQFLHVLGVILHFQDNLILSETVILKPEWGTDAVYKVLDNTTVKQNFGKFTNDDLRNIWSDKQYTRMLPNLLELMMKFKLCYKLPGSESTYIAPQLLDYNQPNYNWNDNNNLLLRYKYDFMPKGIITRFIVEMNRYILEPNVWRNGVLLLRDDTYAEVIESYNKREIRVKLSGTNKRGFLEVITDKLDEIHSSYHQLQVDKLVPCNCSVCRNSQEPYFHPLEQIRTFLGNGKSQIQCGKTGDMIDILSLVDDTIGRQTIMTKESKYNLEGATIYNFAPEAQNSNLVGGKIVKDNIIANTINEAPQQDLPEAAAQIQALLDQLSQTYPTNTTKEKMVIVGEAVDQIENNPTFKAKVINALKAGGIEAFKEAVDHPLINILMATIDGWQNT
ncbi:MAG: COR domain-containing protein [Crocosphaera sp.]